LILERSLAVLALSAFACGPLAPVQAQDAPSDPEVEAGVRQVQEGDFETAVITLEAASRRLLRDAGSSVLRTRAALHLGVAYVALDQRGSAKARFKDALALDPSLRLTTERYSPKVVGVFEEARRERLAEAPAPPGRKRSRVPWVVGGAAVVGGGVVLATRGGGESGGATVFSGARFATPVLDCPDGEVGTPLSVVVLLQARNDSKQAATISGVTATLVIVTSALPEEIGFAISRPATVQPPTVPAGGAATLRVDTTLLCQNGAGDPPRFNEWLGRITLTTVAGAFNLETADRMRVNIP
jgi:hypothetical protein